MATPLLGRRDVLRIGAVAGAATLLPSCATSGTAIVIGSGFGGAIASLRLTKKGVKTILLERGRRWDIENPPQEFSPFCTNLTPDGHSSWLRAETITPPVVPEIFQIGKYIGVLDRIDGNGMNVYTGAGYGGGSLVYGGITLQPSQARFERAFGSLINYAEMNEKWFPLVWKMLQATTAPDDIQAQDYYQYTRVFKGVADMAGLATVQLPTTTNWDIIRNEIAGKYGFQSATHGELIYGNNTGSKISLDQTYLKQAEATGKLDVRLQTQAASISMDGNRYVVEIENIDTSGTVVSTGKLVCDYLFLACGSVYTTQLLFKSRALGGLKNVNDQLGQKWGGNGDSMFLLTGYTDPLGMWQGGPPTLGVDDADNTIAPGYIECAQYPTGMDSHETVHLGVAMTETFGELVYDAASEKCTASFPSDGLAEIQMAVDETADKLASAKSLDVTNVTGFSYHPLGGASMNQVCDTFGRVKGYKNLYVVDSALMPGPSVGINPSLTIAAVVERAMDTIIAKDLKS